MKKLILVLFFLILCSPVYSDDSWDNIGDVDQMWDMQKPVTNQEFEDVIEKLEEKNTQKEAKQRKKKIKKISGGGTSLHGDLDPNKEIKELGNIKKDEYEGNLVNVPVSLIIDGKVIEKGFYKTIGEKDAESGKFYVNFYQSQFFKAKLEVNETQDDFKEETIDFAKIIPLNDSFVKLIFGSIDFNAFAYIPYMKE